MFDCVFERARERKRRFQRIKNDYTTCTCLHLQVLPPLKDVKIRPEIGTTTRNKLVRLMTHVDMGVKQTAAEFLFVLCKESGEQQWWGYMHIR